MVRAKHKSEPVTVGSCPIETVLAFEFVILAVRQDEQVTGDMGRTGIREVNRSQFVSFRRFVVWEVGSKMLISLSSPLWLNRFQFQILPVPKHRLNFVTYLTSSLRSRSKIKED